GLSHRARDRSADRDRGEPGVAPRQHAVAGLGGGLLEPGGATASRAPGSPARLRALALRPAPRGAASRVRGLPDRALHGRGPSPAAQRGAGRVADGGARPVPDWGLSAAVKGGPPPRGRPAEPALGPERQRDDAAVGDDVRLRDVRLRDDALLRDDVLLLGA